MVFRRDRLKIFSVNLNPLFKRVGGSQRNATNLVIVETRNVNELTLPMYSTCYPLTFGTQVNNLLSLQETLLGCKSEMPGN
jgi:hypothetical protein